MTAAGTELRTCDPVTWLWSGQERSKAAVHAVNCLHRAGVTTIADLVQMTPQDLMDLRKFGSRCLEEVRRVLRAQGLMLDGDVDWRRP